MLFQLYYYNNMLEDNYFITSLKLYNKVLSFLSLEHI